MDALCRVFEDRIRSYSQILALVDEESAAIAERRTDRLDQILASKRGIIDSIRRADDEAAPLRTRWEAVRDSLPEDAKADLQKRHDELSALLKNLIDRERENEAALQAAAGKVQSQLQDAVQRKAAFNAYSRAGGGDPRFMDRTK